MSAPDPNGTTETQNPVGSSELVRHPYLGPWQLLPAKPGTCPECATTHEPEWPHNAQSVFYQYDFYGKHGRWATWKDAMAHCSPEMQQIWIRELAVEGIILEA